MSPGSEHRVGDRYVAELANPRLSLVVTYNVFQRWTITVIDRNQHCPLVELHDEGSLEQAQRYAEGYVHGAFGKDVSHAKWIGENAARR